eukprot:359236-Chlamydomonas_euryale.AAC.14
MQSPSMPLLSLRMRCAWAHACRRRGRGATAGRAVSTPSLGRSISAARKCAFCFAGCACAGAASDEP